MALNGEVRYTFAQLQIRRMFTDFIKFAVQSFGDSYPGPNCFRPIEITYNGKTAQATIMDKVRPHV